MDQLPADVLGQIGGRSSNLAFGQITRDMQSTLDNSDTFWKTKVVQELGLNFSNMKELYTSLKRQQMTSITFSKERTSTCTCIEDGMWSEDCWSVAEQWNFRFRLESSNRNDGFYLRGSDDLTDSIDVFVAELEKNPKACLTLYDHKSDIVLLQINEKNTMKLSAHLMSGEGAAGSQINIYNVNRSEIVQMFREIAQCLEDEIDKHRKLRRPGSEYDSEECEDDTSSSEDDNGLPDGKRRKLDSE
jgi:hypothetical protein